MGSDRIYARRRRRIPVFLLLGLALFALGLAWAVSGIRQAALASEREGLAQAERAVRSAAVSLYALDGAYPASYAALKARSGIAVDEEKYIVFYWAFASNIMPEITVVRRAP